MHEDQVLFSAGIAHQLVVDNFPQFHLEPMQLVDSQGTVNATYRVGSAATARFPLRVSDPRQLAAELERESKAMVEFANSCPFPTPKPLGIGQPGRSFPMPWSMQTWIDGAVATPADLAASPAFAMDVASLIESLRSADTSGREFTGTGRGGRISDHDDWVQTCLHNSVDLLDVARLHPIWEQLRQLPPTHSDVMSHKDLISANILCTRGAHHRCSRCRRLRAARSGARPDRRLAPSRRVVRSRLNITREELLRGAAWAFQQAIGLVWYYRLTTHV